ncbi:MAG TPA: CehA/McbA family metallohydrolase [Chloroflexota bacterium]|nr:CehA/McbA family metallohydrolase [Chloroflexota bacterium]
MSQFASSLPFSLPGRFYRGNLHTHSNLSDGALAPEKVVAIYRDAGYDFLVITDHFLENYHFPITDTRAFRTESFTTMLGAELHAPRLANGQIWHIVAVGLPADFAPTSPSESGPELARRAAAAGAFVGIAHPAWYGLSLDDARSLDAAHAIEIYNETCFALNDRGDSWYVADSLLGQGDRYFTYAADDAHLLSARPDACAAWVQVRAQALDPASLLAALKAGHFYSSQGPEIHDVQIDAQHIRVICSPASHVYVSGTAPLARQIHGADLTSVDLPRQPFENSYVRVTVVDERGKRAWSNPFWLS